MTAHVLYVIACAAPPTRHVGKLISAAQRTGWDTCLLTTPSAARFVDVPVMEELTGHPVHSQYKDPTGPDDEPMTNDQGLDRRRWRSGP